MNAKPSSAASVAPALQSTVGRAPERARAVATTLETFDVYPLRSTLVGRARPSQHRLTRTFGINYGARPRGVLGWRGRAGQATSAGIIAGAMSPRISIDRDAVSAFCQRHHIARLALFGSVLREDFGPHSDVDVLVEFQPGHTPGLAFVSMERELSTLLHGRRVDLVTRKFLNPRIRDQVLEGAEPVYVAA